VELGKVKNGVPTMTVTLPKNSEHYSRVKFFVCDNLGDGVSQTQSFGAGVKGLIHYHPIGNSVWWGGVRRCGGFGAGRLCANARAVSCASRRRTCARAR
jgi:hypothetical protein